MPVNTEEWEYFSKRPIRRGLALTRAAIGVLVARGKARRLDRRSCKAEADMVRQGAADALTDRLIRLGPTYVKLGQIASCREEIEGTVWAESLARLQDNVPPFSSEAAMAAMELELGTPLNASFAYVEAEPLAAASLGQVHRGKLLDGEPVAIKIQRPGLLSIYETDAKVLRKLARACDWFSKKRRSESGELSWLELCDDSIAVLFRELDYRREAKNGLLLGQCLAEYSDWVRCPGVYESLTTDKMLVMEYVEGISLKKLDKLEERGFDRKLLAERLARAYLLQFCKFGVFNADPHAGNLAADSAGRLVIYDFGQVAELTETQRRGVFNVIQAIIDLDAAACVRAFEEMGVLKPGYDARSIINVVQSNFDSGRVKTRAASTASKTRINKSSSSKGTRSDAAVLQYFQLPPTYAFVARALSQLTGVGLKLDPDFEFIAAAAPLLPEITGARTYVKDQFLRRWRAFTNFFLGPRLVASR